MFEKKKDELDHNESYETIVGPTIAIEGDFSGKGNILVQGTINGSISTENDIKIDDGAKVNATISASNAIIAGQVIGNITVKSRINLLSTCKIEGDIEASVINMSAGASFNGHSKMTGQIKDTNVGSSKLSPQDKSEQKETADSK